MLSGGSVRVYCVDLARLSRLIPIQSWRFRLVCELGWRTSLEGHTRLIIETMYFNAREDLLTRSIFGTYGNACAYSRSAKELLCNAPRYRSVRPFDYGIKDNLWYQNDQARGTTSYSVCSSPP